MARHLLVTNDYPPKTGGIQVYLHELWRRLEDGRAVVLTASSHEHAAVFDASSEIVVERVSSSTLFLPSWRAYRAIEAAIEPSPSEAFYTIWANQHASEPTTALGLSYESCRLE